MFPSSMGDLSSPGRGDARPRQPPCLDAPGQDVDGLGHDVRVVIQIVAENKNVSAGLHGPNHRLLKAVMGGDCAHLHVVGDDDAFKPQPLAQKARQHGGRKRGREFGVEAVQKEVPAHDHGAGPKRDEPLVGDEFRLAPGPGDVRQAQVRIGHGAAVAGEMLEAGQHPARPEPLAEGQGVGRHGLRVRGEAALQGADGRAVGVDVHVGHGREIDVDAQVREHPPRPFAPLPRSLRRPPPHGPGRWAVRKARLLAQPAHPSALLVHGDEERRRRRGLQAGCQGADLPGALDVAAGRAQLHVAVEKNHPAQVVFPDVAQDGRVIGKFRTPEADQEHLAEHGSQGRFRAGGAKGRGQHEREGESGV
jgi:hypothetical protein